MSNDTTPSWTTARAAAVTVALDVPRPAHHATAAASTTAATQAIAIPGPMTTFVDPTDGA